MKTILLARHAKSSWDHPALADHDRPLNTRGLRDATRMGVLLHSRNVAADIIVSSTALRAANTARLLAEGLSYDIKSIITSAALYLADARELLNYISALPEEFNTALLVAHNPGISRTATVLSGTQGRDMPTCAVYCLDTPAASWREAAETRAARVRLYLTPKDGG